MNKIPGQPCQYCGTPYSPSKNNPSEGYCYPCWKKWKEGKEKRVVTEQTPLQDETIEKMRLWGKGVQAKMNTLEQRIAILEKNYSEVINLIPLMEKIAGEPATTLHKSMSGKTIEEIAIEMGGKIVDDIPVIL